MSKKINIVVRLQHWMDSVPGQTFLNYAYSWGASIVILGALFKLTHLPGGNFMLFIGMGTEVVVFFLAAFDRPFDKDEVGKELPPDYETDEEIADRMGISDDDETNETDSEGKTFRAEGQVAGGGVVIGGGTGGGGTASDEVCIEGTNSVITASGHLLIEGQFYFALHDYYPVMSAYAAPELLAEYVATYTEGDLKNWRIPTEDEARFMKEIFATTSIADKTSPTYWLNIALANIQADLLDTSMRYLCEDGTKTFRFYPNTNITKAGSKTKYRLRLVHD